jgi:phosphoenolpyruvate-protein kinase (PTS system EI component)
LYQIGEAITQQKKHNWPILVRTLDVGGDKELPYVQLAPEANPFLGVRALRLSLRRPELFLPQLRAILRAGADFHYRMMFPMVANLDEILQARQFLHQAHQELTDEKIPHGWPIEMGIMVEIPSAALLSPLLAEHVEFFSIGTNDLTQYTLAAERGNPLLSGLADALHPAVLRLVGEVASASHKFGKWTGVCGELAGDPLAVPVLVGLGVDELSMNPGSVPRAKAILSKIDTAQAVGLAESVLAAPGAVEARAIARQFYEQFVLPKL